MSPTNVTPGSDTSTPAENGVADEFNVTVPSAFDVAPPRLVFALAPPARVAAAATASTRMSFLIAPPCWISLPPGPNGLVRLQSFPQPGLRPPAAAHAIRGSGECRCSALRPCDSPPNAGRGRRRGLLEVEQLAARVAVEGLDVGVLPGRAGFDVGDGGAVEAAP